MNFGIIGITRTHPDELGRAWVSGLFGNQLVSSFSACSDVLLRGFGHLINSEKTR